MMGLFPMLPVLVVLFSPLKSIEYWIYGFTIFFLALLGATAAKTGGSGIAKAVVRVTVWGTLAMLVSAFVGFLFGAQRKEIYLSLG